MDTSETPPLPTDPAPIIPPPPTTSPTPGNPRPKTSVHVPPLSEIAREYMESVRRQAAFTHTPRFQELLSQGLSQASPQRSLFRHPSSAFRALPPPQGPPPLPVLPAPRKSPLASRLPQLVAAEPPARRSQRQLRSN